MFESRVILDRSQTRPQPRQPHLQFESRVTLVKAQAEAFASACFFINSVCADPRAGWVGAYGVSFLSITADLLFVLFLYSHPEFLHQLGAVFYCLYRSPQTNASTQVILGIRLCRNRWLSPASSFTVCEQKACFDKLLILHIAHFSFCIVMFNLFILLLVE